MCRPLGIPIFCTQKNLLIIILLCAAVYRYGNGLCGFDIEVSSAWAASALVRLQILVNLVAAWTQSQAGLCPLHMHFARCQSMHDTE